MKFIVLIFICLSSAFATTPAQLDTLLLNSVRHFNKQVSINYEELKSIITKEGIRSNEKIYNEECLKQLAEYSRSSYLLSQDSSSYIKNYNNMVKNQGSLRQNSILLIFNEKMARL